MSDRKIQEDNEEAKDRELDATGVQEQKKHGATRGRDLSFEEIIVLANRFGLAFVEKKKEADRLDLLRTSVRSRIMNRIEETSEEKVSENKLKRLAEADPEYLELLEQTAEARAEADKLKVRYESYRNLFEARRTLISYRKTELKSL